MTSSIQSQTNSFMYDARSDTDLYPASWFQNAPQDGIEFNCPLQDTVRLALAHKEGRREPKHVPSVSSGRGVRRMDNAVMVRNPRAISYYYSALYLINAHPQLTDTLLLRCNKYITATATTVINCFRPPRPVSARTGHRVRLLSNPIREFLKFRRFRMPHSVNHRPVRKYHVWFKLIATHTHTHTHVDV